MLLWLKKGEKNKKRLVEGSRSQGGGAHLGVLGAGDVHERLGGGVNDVEELRSRTGGGG